MSNHSTKRVNTGISAESLCLGLAMWMEMFPEHTVEQCASLDSRVSTADSGKTNELYRNVGCVLVQENGRLLAVDRSRDDVHGLARLLVKHHDRVKGCSAFLSRKPCTYCAKLLVQAGVTAVSYPPVEPEYLDTRKEEDRVEALLDAGQITQSVFVPRIKMDLDEEFIAAKEISLNDVREFSEKVSRRFWNAECARRMAVDSIEETYNDFQNLVKWFAQIYLSLECVKFKLSVRCGEPCINSPDKTVWTFDPENNLYQEQIAKHMLGIAVMTIQRTVESKTGVGCVIMKNNDVIAVGWNDFPSKIIEEDFHHASDQERDKKYPFFVHAEQNALLARNTTDITGGIIFVTKIPCHECTPLVKIAGIETVVLATSLKPIKEKYRLNYDVFQEEVKKGSFLCYETKTMLD
ncbi:Cytidine and dCMP deaminase domain-containing protein 1 [Desmophyllum pertusum]|uniref:dCMP deaminase n=1 Tax=Desmophyllum pertusum TaxID=174260 RepID=A0A9W9Z4V9_9CNID|nr:Cytidine and dCMP deaminase domain-containing protein 1 [Desmophyllum pertusum]